jgi:hypothetical protein
VLRSDLVLAIVLIFAFFVGVVVVATWRSAKSEGYKALIFALIAVVVGTLLPIFARPIEAAWDDATGGVNASAPELDPDQEGIECLYGTWDAAADYRIVESYDFGQVTLTPLSGGSGRWTFLPDGTGIFDASLVLAGSFSSGQAKGIEKVTTLSGQTPFSYLADENTVDISYRAAELKWKEEVRGQSTGGPLIPKSGKFGYTCLRDSLRFAPDAQSIGTDTTRSANVIHYASFIRSAT